MLHSIFSGLRKALGWLRDRLPPGPGTTAISEENNIMVSTTPATPALPKVSKPQRYDFEPNNIAGILRPASQAGSFLPRQPLTPTNSANHIKSFKEARESPCSAKQRLPSVHRRLRNGISCSATPVIAPDRRYSRRLFMCETADTTNISYF